MQEGRLLSSFHGHQKDMCTLGLGGGDLEEAKEVGFFKKKKIAL